MDAIFEALWFGVKVTMWLFTGIVRGPRDILGWLGEREEGVHRPFPVKSILWFILSAIVLIACFAMTAGR